VAHVIALDAGFSRSRKTKEQLDFRNPAYLVNDSLFMTIGAMQHHAIFQTERIEIDDTSDDTELAETKRTFHHLGNGADSRGGSSNVGGLTTLRALRCFLLPLSLAPAEDR
jgi:hypothetical protein